MIWAKRKSPVRWSRLGNNELKSSIAKRALVLRLSSMGDVVLSTAAIEPLKRAGYEISFVTKRSFAPLLHHHPDLNEIFPYGDDGGEKVARDKFFAWYEAREFDVVLDLQDSWRTFFWRRRLKKRAALNVARKERFREWMILVLRLGRWFSFGRGGRAKKSRRLAVDFLTLKKVFVSSSGLQTRLGVSEAERAEVRKFLPQGDFVVLLPGSAWKGKQWPYFPELAAILSRKVSVVALGSAKDEVCDEVARLAVGPFGAVSLRGKTDIRQSLAIIAEARWVIGNDTGMVHAAEALGKDVAMIEGPTHPALGFSPYRERSIVIGLDLFCRPCSKSGRICPRMGTWKCLRDLSVQDVAGKLRRWGLPC